ncbi:hypothetical protein OY671_005093 [Metschnikowia pulcherrima]|nr:hypothetical protein OY671_005093 [Metschnikowia pulcherrima]
MPPKSAVASKLQYVSVRKATFTEGVRVGNAKSLKYWPHDTPAPEDMAELGFYYTPTRTQGDQVTCFWCGKKEKGWRGVESPSSMHYEHNKKCPYAVIYHFLTNYKNDADSATYWARLTDENESPMSVLEPHSSWSVSLRLSTFKNLWKYDSRKKTKVTARGMANAGFFFAPLHPDDDRVICMYCGLPLSDWDLGDDPWLEHENNSEEFRSGATHKCHFLVTSQEPEAETSIAEQAEFEHIPLSAPGTPDKEGDEMAAQTPPHPDRKSASGSSSDGSRNSLLATVMSPQSPDDPKDAPAHNDLNDFDISIDQLSDHGTHLDREANSLRRYPRRRKQPAFPKSEPNIKSSASLVLEVRQEHVQEAEHDEEAGNVDSVSTLSANEENSPGVSIDAELSLPLDGDTSVNHDISSSSVPQDTEDGDYAESVEELPSHSENEMFKPEKGSGDKALSRSRFASDEFGINEKDIASILNSPKKDRKMKLVRKQAPIPPPVSFHDISDQNLGDYDEQNLSFIEKDLRVEEPKNIKESSETTTNDGILKEHEMSPPQRAGSNTKKESHKYVIPDSSVVEISRSEARVQENVPEMILVDSPEKGEVSNSDNEDKELSSNSEEEESVMDIDSASPKKPVNINNRAAAENIDDDVILDSFSPEKDKHAALAGLKASANEGQKPLFESEHPPMSESTRDDMEIDQDMPIKAEVTVTGFGNADELAESHSDENNSLTDRPKPESNTINKKSSVSADTNMADPKMLENVAPESKSESPVQVKSEGDKIKPEPIGKSDEIKRGKMNSQVSVTRAADETDQLKKTESDHELSQKRLHGKVSSTGKRSFDEQANKLTVKRSRIENASPGKYENAGFEIHDEAHVSKADNPHEQSRPDGNTRIGSNSEGGSKAILPLPEKGSSNTDQTNAATDRESEEPEASPTKDVIISPSSYKEYIENFQKMSEEFGEASIDVSRMSSSNNEEDRLLGSKDSYSEDKIEPEKVISGAEEGVNGVREDKKADNTENENAQMKNGQSHIPEEQGDEQHELPSYIGDSASEVPPLLSMSPAKVSAGTHMEEDESKNVEDALESEQENPLEKASASAAPKESENNIQPVVTDRKTEPSLEGLQNLTKHVTEKGQKVSQNPSPALKLTSEADPPQKVHRLSHDAALTELDELDDAIDYITGLTANGFELHNDAEGALTNFISAMPEEEEEMTVEEWIRHNAASCRKIVEDSAEKIIANYGAEFDKVIEYAANLETID